MNAPSVVHPTGLANFYAVDRGDGYRFWYSYTTIVAFQTPDTGMTISKNVWSTTTGKHLNLIEPDHSVRLDYDEFKKHLALALDNYSIAEIPG